MIRGGHRTDVRRIALLGSRLHVLDTDYICLLRLQALHEILTEVLLVLPAGHVANYSLRPKHFTRLSAVLSNVAVLLLYSQRARTTAYDRGNASYH